MLHIVHGDGVDHYHSVILPVEEQEDINAMMEEKGQFDSSKKARNRLPIMWRESYCSRPSAGPPFSTSEMTMEVSPL